MGKTNAITDIVKVVNRELRSGAEQDFVIPDSAFGVAQTLLQYQSSHRPIGSVALCIHGFPGGAGLVATEIR